MKAVVLAGGSDKRISILTGGMPKTMLRLAGKRLVDRIVESIIGIGIREIIVVLTPCRDCLWSPRPGVRLVLQDEEGVVSAAIRGLSEAGRGEILLAYGDIVAGREMYRGLLDTHASTGADVTLAAVPIGHALETYNRLLLGEDGVVADAGWSVAETSYVFGGAAVGDRDLLLEAFRNPGDKGVLRTLLGRGDVRAYVWRGLWHDVDTPWDLLAASMELLGSLRKSVISGSARISERASLEGPLLVDDDARIDHGAVVRGPAYLGRGVLVGVNSFVREFTDAEEHVIIGSHSEVKRTVLQPKAYIGSYAYVADSLIGEGASLSPYTVTVNSAPREIIPPRLRDVAAKLSGQAKMGAVVGRGMKIGFRAVLKPGEIAGFR